MCVTYFKARLLSYEVTNWQVTSLLVKKVPKLFLLFTLKVSFEFICFMLDYFRNSIPYH